MAQHFRLVNWYHLPSGFGELSKDSKDSKDIGHRQVSPDKGVVVDGQEYRLSPQDIDLDAGRGQGAKTGRPPSSMLDSNDG